MHTSVLTTLLLSIVWLPLRAQEIRRDSSSTNNRVYSVVQQVPEFPGGMTGLRQYIKDNLQYPEVARVTKLAGRVFVRFIVTKQGTIEDVAILKGISPEINAEAIRLVKGMPTWKPGVENGQAVDCRFNLPINFSPN